MAAPQPGEPLLDFRADMERLRAECPWKREQTHRSLARYLQEEAYEVLEAIDTGDPDHLREELGDLLLQVYFHAVIAEEAGDFTLDDVARGIAEKMRLRNPHVFAVDTPTTLSAAEVNDRWQQIKETEKPRVTPYDGIPEALPALLLATKVLERLGEPAAALPPAERDPADETAIGDRLLAVVSDALAAGVDPEQALRAAVRRRTPR
ncbi:MazG family protein [Nocardioides cynanchi]|uniref:MazG family protein n=1 Tax=Nocardioides cynanchi TaxID=2558918 RepID=UPI001247CD7F|nr:MazG family protein [Nocardioides cynanchi]